MGLFSSKKKTKVFTSINRVVEDSHLPNSVLRGAQTAISDNKPDEMVDYAIEEMTNSIALKAERMYEYAKRSYVYGLPSGKYRSSMEGREEVQTILDAQEGKPVLIKYSQFGPPNILHIAWMKLIELHQYNTVSNKLGHLSSVMGKSVYLEDMVIELPIGSRETYEDGALDQWGISPRAGYTPQRAAYRNDVAPLVGFTPPGESSTVTDESVLVTATWQREVERAWIDSDGDHHISYYPCTTTFSLSVQGYTDLSDYFHVMYEVDGVTKYWMYEAGIGTYPTLDAFLEGVNPEVHGKFFPFAYFRYNKQSTNQDTTTEAYKTTKKMVSYIGMEFDTVADAINSSPDIKDVEQAILFMAVPAVTTNEIESRYLYEFFDEMYYGVSNQYTSHDEASISSRFGYNTKDDRADKNTLIIQDKLFKLSLSNDGIYKKRRVGTIGKVGTFTNGRDSQSREYTYTSYRDGEATQRTGILTTYYHYYRKQIAPGIYDELMVVNLSLRYHIWGKYSTVGDESDNILMIPIDRTISEKYSIVDREMLFARSLHIIFNYRVVIKVPWYAQSWFRVVLIIVAINITILTWGTGSGPMAALLSSTTTLAAQVALQALMMSILKVLVVMVVAKILVNKFGAKLGILGAVLAMCAAIYGVTTGVGGLQGAPWASQMFTASSALGNASQAQIKDDMSELQQDMTEFRKETEQMWELLDKANDKLDRTYLPVPSAQFWEKPEDFYNRTIHSGNIGALGFDAVTNYVDVALTLPTLNDTMRGIAK